MTTQNDLTEKQRVTRMLRRIRTGDRVLATIRSPRAGKTGTVVNPEPFSADGVRRASVKYDNGPTVQVLPSSIELID